MAEASEPIVLPYNKYGSDVRGSIHDLAGYEHIHTEDGLCRKDRSYTCTAPKWEWTGVRANPFPGQVLREVNFGDPSWYEENAGEYRPVTWKAADATVVTSEVCDAEGRNQYEPRGTHKPVLDIDLPVKLIPSSTEGHFHLFIDKEMSWKDYTKLLDVLAEVGIIEQGFSRVSQGSRQHTAVRLPWVKKEANDENV